jgi:hypothetical protein
MQRESYGVSQSGGRPRRRPGEPLLDFLERVRAWQFGLVSVEVRASAVKGGNRARRFTR